MSSYPYSRHTSSCYYQRIKVVYNVYRYNNVYRWYLLFLVIPTIYDTLENATYPGLISSLKYLEADIPPKFSKDTFKKSHSCKSNLALIPTVPLVVRESTMIILLPCFRIMYFGWFYGLVLRLTTTTTN